MNRLWQIWIQALEYGIDTDQLFFDISATFSPYSEVTLKSFEAWNKELFHQEIAVNPFYSYEEIFRHLLKPSEGGIPKLTLAACDMMLHHIAGIDSLSGMTKEDFYLDFMAEDMEREVLGRDCRIRLFNWQEKKYLARQLLRLYSTNQYSFCLARAVEHCFPHSRVNLAEQGRVMVFMNQKKTEEAADKIGFLAELFLNLDQEPELYWTMLPGVVEREETMVIEDFLVG